MNDHMVEPSLGGEVEGCDGARWDSPWRGRLRGEGMLSDLSLAPPGVHLLLLSCL